VLERKQAASAAGAGGELQLPGRQFGAALVADHGVARTTAHTVTLVHRRLDPRFVGRVLYGIVVADCGADIRILGNYLVPTLARRPAGFRPRHGMGLSLLVSTGNELSVSATAVLEYPVADEATRVIARRTAAR